MIEELTFSELGTLCAKFELTDNDFVNEKKFFILSLSTCDPYVIVKPAMSKAQVVVKDDEGIGYCLNIFFISFYQLLSLD